MSGVGKIQAAIASATLEITLALANVNFDFSLVKVEAPAEYKALGAALSTKLRSAAEHGTDHMTARKLGCLFEEILLSTPRLLKAYGIRASEIAESPSVNPRGNKDYGPFNSHVGVDGTSIWAAATSGTSAIAVHLLACMLARIWPASEATGIWVQIVDERKRELSIWNDHQAIPVRNLAAGQVMLSPDQLADWDSSARAWLRAADLVKELNQKQLMLIVKNLNVPVNKGMGLYASVMEAWKTAMETTEKLIDGVSHSISNGAVLLGLTAWHLYPDLIILGKTIAHVRQKDPLVTPSGTVTVGLQGIESEDSPGVHWSLSLAHVRYYGDPVESERSLNTDLSRISFDDLFQVFLGDCLERWGSTEHGPEIIVLIWQTCKEWLAASNAGAHEHVVIAGSWLELLAGAAQRYISSSGQERQSCKRLWGLGTRRSSLLGANRTKVPFFGLDNSKFVAVLNPEAKIRYLRSVAANWREHTDTLLIVVREGSSGAHDRWKTDSVVLLATADTRRTSETTTNQGSKDLAQERWIVQNEVLYPMVGPSQIDGLFGAEDGENVRTVDRGSLRWTTNERLLWVNAPARDEGELPQPSKQPEATDRKSRRWGRFSRNAANRTVSPVRTARTGAHFLFVRYGDIDSAGLFIKVRSKYPESEGEVVARKVGMELPVIPQDILNAIKSNCIKPQKLYQHSTFGYLSSSPKETSGIGMDLIYGLQALATAANVYTAMTNVTVALKLVTRSPLNHALWFPKDKGHLNLLVPPELSRSAAFACISMLESGNFDIDPSVLTDVIAMSTEDSIFVSAIILSDPASQSEHSAMRRIPGNIGRAGHAFLVGPRNPRVRKTALESYQLINHNAYDGRLEDNFRSTTLHLGFTGYELSLGTGNRGERHREAFLLEAVISAHDRGNWVSDLDPLLILKQEVRQPFNALPTNCAHNNIDRIRSAGSSLISVDNWEELLEIQGNAAVVRAHGKWVARLAAAAISLQMGNTTVVLSGEGCRKCSDQDQAVRSRILADELKKEGAKNSHVYKTRTLILATSGLSSMEDFITARERRREVATVYIL